MMPECEQVQMASLHQTSKANVTSDTVLEGISDLIFLGNVCEPDLTLDAMCEMGEMVSDVSPNYTTSQRDTVWHTKQD